ncbi:MAG: UvrD-helicase domain-containing protein [Ignavibacteria bacterium]|nr:UvrD-helicase domain-containing protein [Ignavibacteria bacterium]
MTLKLVSQSDHVPAEDLLDGLNQRQAEAVTHTEGPLLIIAGAGSGKTRVLTVRIAYLLRLGVHPSHILSLTFTNKAAQEMKERVGELVGGSVSRSMWVGTFHSLFARILRQHADRIGYTSSFTIYDSDDQLAAIKAVMNQLGVSQQAVPPNGVKGRISNAKNEMMSWQEYSRRASTISEKQTAQIYELYEKRLKHSNAMDFDDLLLNTIILLDNHTDVLEGMHDRFKYLCVDEYQDTNRAQYRVVNILAKKFRNICVVGDDAQSIYRWRGADIRNILEFERDYPDARVVRLEQNYRSTKTILAAADSVIKNNEKQLRKTLWTENVEGEKITVLSCRDDREEAESIVRTIKNRIEKNLYRYSDTAVLYRTNAQSQALEDALRRANLPYLIVSGVSFYKRKEVKDTLAYLRLLVNPADAESLLRIVNEPARGIGQTSLNRMQEYAVNNSTTLFDVMADASVVPQIQQRVVTAARNFVELVERHREVLNDLPPATLAQQYIESTGLPTMYKQQDTEESLDKWNNIERILDHILEQQEIEENLTLASYLETVALVSEQDDPQLGSNRIALMTMHASKGLEFPLVVIAGLEQGLFPLAKAETDPGEQEEERRLFYVGITRAREELILSYAERRYRFGELSFSRPSTFLSELDQNTLAPSGRSVAVSAKIRRTVETYSQMPVKEDYSQLSVKQSVKTGQRVKHPMFGVGVVVDVSGYGSSAKATVEFSNGQKKQLMLSYARLEQV